MPKNKYKVSMRIRGTILKPSYEGEVEVFAENKADAIQIAIDECRRKAHWDSPKENFIIKNVEQLSTCIHN